MSLYLAADFRGRKTPAPLKEGLSDRRRNPGADFRGRKTPAPLKVDAQAG